MILYEYRLSLNQIRNNRKSQDKDFVHKAQPECRFRLRHYLLKICY